MENNISGVMTNFSGNLMILLCEQTIFLLINTLSGNVYKRSKYFTTKPSDFILNKKKVKFLLDFH